MNKLVFAAVLSLGFCLVQCSEDPPESIPDKQIPDGSSLVQAQAQQDYAHHQQQIGSHKQGQDYGFGQSQDQGLDRGSSGFKSGYDQNGGLHFQFDNQGAFSRDRGYGYEKAYAYSRDTAFLDFVDDKGALTAKDLVEQQGNINTGGISGSNKIHDYTKGSVDGYGQSQFDLDSTEQKVGFHN